MKAGAAKYHALKFDPAPAHRLVALRVDGALVRAGLGQDNESQDRVLVAGVDDELSPC